MAGNRPRRRQTGRGRSRKKSRKAGPLDNLGTYLHRHGFKRVKTPNPQVWAEIKKSLPKGARAQVWQRGNTIRVILDRGTGRAQQKVFLWDVTEAGYKLFPASKIQGQQAGGVQINPRISPQINVNPRISPQITVRPHIEVKPQINVQGERVAEERRLEEERRVRRPELEIDVGEGRKRIDEVLGERRELIERMTAGQVNHLAFMNGLESARKDIFKKAFADIGIHLERVQNRRGQNVWRLTAPYVQPTHPVQAAGNFVDSLLHTMEASGKNLKVRRRILTRLKSERGRQALLTEVKTTLGIITKLQRYYNRLDRECNSHYEMLERVPTAKQWNKFDSAIDASASQFDKMRHVVEMGFRNALLKKGIGSKKGTDPMGLFRL